MTQYDERWFLNAVWGPRAEPVESCARRLQNLLRELADIDATLARWFLTVPRLEDAREPVDLDDVQAFVRILSRGITRTDAPPHQPMPELGWNVSLWNGDVTNGAKVIVNCGMTSRYVQNQVHVDLPPFASNGIPMVKIGELVKRIVYAAVSSWYPDWCAVTSSELLKKTNRRMDDFLTAWITYVSPRLRPRVGELPARARVLTHQDGGIIVMTASSVKDVSLEVIDRVREQVVVDLGAMR